MALKGIILICLMQIFYCNAEYSGMNQDHFIKKFRNSSLESKQSRCECYQYNCGCCIYMNVPKIYLNDTGCVNMSYLPKEYGIKLTVTIDKWDLINVTVSAKNPPPICFGEEFFAEHADLCLRFYDLNATYSSLHGCAQLLARLERLVLARYDLGCFDLGNQYGLKLPLQKVASSIEAKALHIPQIFKTMKYKFTNQDI